MLEIKLDNMKEYNNLVYDLYKYYDKNTAKLVESSGKFWIKILLNSTYGSYKVSHTEQPINEKRSDKLNRILNESK